MKVQLLVPAPRQLRRAGGRQALRHLTYNIYISLSLYIYIYIFLSLSLYIYI